MTGRDLIGAGRRLVRPYTITSGRPGVGLDHLALESLVKTTPLGGQKIDSHKWEQADLLVEAMEPIAVIELASRLGVALGVVKVLVADLEQAELVEVTVTPEDSNAEYTNLLEQVLDGIKSL